jgi:uncharacterized protein
LRQGSSIARDSNGLSAPALSAEIFSIPLDEHRYLIYAPRRRSAFVGNEATVNVVADLKEGKYSLDVDPGGAVVALLRRLQMVDGGPEPSPVTEFAGEPEPVAVTLFMTTACNLRCTYCYANAGSTPTAFMPLDVAKRAIDFVAANAVKKGLPGFEVGYHGGGETTVNWRVMVSSLAYAKERAAALQLGVAAGAATNGLLNDRQIAWFVRNLSSATVSFDGLPAIQDANRPIRTGKGSSERVAHTLESFDRANFPYDLRLTVTKDDIPWLPDSVEYVLSRFRPQHVQAEPVYQLGRWHDGPSAETDQFVRAFRSARAVAREYGIELEYSAARLDVLTNHFCGISQDSFCVSPNGNVSACYETFSEQEKWAPVFFYGKARAGTAAGYEFDLKVLQHLRNQSVQHRPYCQGCFAKWHCAGDCYHKSLQAGPNEEFRGSGRCEVTRSLTLDLILERIRDNGGFVWNGNEAVPPVAGGAAGLPELIPAE